ncbi:hypothetical protein HMPREF3069_04995 [Achromobacter xylosoxidans]|uniref:hypothetical protein n=1 Tax=Achromobacter TaxID=222 RepID=UPI0008A23B47|nr:hypothetical protein [Achromobacter xylosoxidans]OFS61651.1 hypothetical protein HMPREF3069_04995 [Achromobacter xylosoxidans]
MGVAFDIQADSRFKGSLEALDEGQSDAVLLILSGIQAAGLPWAAFEQIYGWERLVLEGQDTYPGALELYSFFLQLPSGDHIEIIGHKYNDLLVVCSVARIA